MKPIKKNAGRNNKKGMHIIITGGTLDFTLSPQYEIETRQVDKLVPRNISIVPEFLGKKVNLRSNEVLFSRVCLRDSRDITNEDRDKLLEQIANSPYEQVLVTHGIVKMEETAEYLRSASTRYAGKRVGIVGSRMPLQEYRSDAGFHLGYATGKLQSAKQGLHTFHPESVRSDIKSSIDNIVFLITGGTIDSYFSQFADTAVPYEHSRIAEYFETALGVKPDEPDLTFREICMKDSRELPEEKIRHLIEEAANQGNRWQIVTAGTYALPDLANRFDKIMGTQLPDSKYIFVGAMLPDDVRLNDGWFNLGFALGKIQDLKNGVYVAMHGWATQPSNVMKQLHEARFNLYDANDRA